MTQPYTPPALPTPRSVWDAEYANATWDCLKATEEVARYSVLFGFLLHTRTNRNVLDVGCGEGVLLEYLERSGYEQYLGIDISEVAIRKVLAKVNSRTHFVVANVENFCPAGTFDSLIFNESIYYFCNPLQVLERYRSLLSDSGIVVISMFLSHWKIRDLSQQIASLYECLESVNIQNQRGTWVCSLFANRRRINTMPQTKRE
jgi:2-polyprenyl-3-methyl-5-hydroxy-6-metoxy-1,4-benzoquinol methylase